MTTSLTLPNIWHFLQILVAVSVCGKLKMCMKESYCRSTQLIIRWMIQHLPYNNRTAESRPCYSNNQENRVNSIHSNKMKNQSSRYYSLVRQSPSMVRLSYPIQEKILENHVNTPSHTKRGCWQEAGYFPVLDGLPGGNR